MEELAERVWRLRGWPPNAVNVYVVGTALVDAGTERAKRRILREVRGVSLDTHVVTHAHPDHFGSSHSICTELTLPLWTGSRDADALERGRPVSASRLLNRLPAPAGHPVSRRLREGDEVAGFYVLDVPGHSPGHIALWREHDRALLCGDVFFNFPRLGAPPRLLTVDPVRNRESMRRLAGLRPALVLFGHGPPSPRPGAARSGGVAEPQRRMISTRRPNELGSAYSMTKRAATWPCIEE